MQKPSFWTQEKIRASCFRRINLSTAESAQRRGRKGALSWVIGVIIWRIWFLVSSNLFGLVTTTPCGPFPMMPTSRESGAAQRIMGLVVLNGFQWRSTTRKWLQIPWALRTRCPTCWTYGSSYYISLLRGSKEIILYYIILVYFIFMLCYVILYYIMLFYINVI